MSSLGPASKLEQRLNGWQNLLKIGNWIQWPLKDPISRRTQKRERNRGKRGKSTGGSECQKPGVECRADLKVHAGISERSEKWLSDPNHSFTQLFIKPMFMEIRMLARHYAEHLRLRSLLPIGGNKQETPSVAILSHVHPGPAGARQAPTHCALNPPTF